MLFKWKDNFSCNIDEIDKQHKELFAIGSKIYSIVSLKDECDHYDEIMAILDELKEYTIKHFNYEEKLMDQYKFMGFENHKIEHDFFIKKLQRLERKDLDSLQGEALMEMVTFVADWVSSHILKTDFEYKAFFNEKGVY